MNARIFATGALTAIALILLALTSFSAYSQPEFDTDNLFGLISPALAGAIPPLAAIGFGTARSLGSFRLLGLGALVSAIYFVVPLYIGLRAQAASDLQLSVASTFISWLAAAAGLAGLFAASLVIFVYNQIAAGREYQQTRRLVRAIEQQTAARLRSGTPAAIELGPVAFETLTRDWGAEANTLVIARANGRYLGLASPRWPAKPAVPALELEIVHTGTDDHVQVR
jgi:hypothetical protein